MIIRCWGARGSLPVSGPEFSQFGGNTTCIEIRSSQDDIIIIDAGNGIRKLANSLIKEGRFDYNMLFTHAHWDHIIGFPFFKPIYMDQTKVKIFGCSLAQGSIKDIISHTMSTPYFPVNFEFIQAKFEFQGRCNHNFKIGSISVSPIPLCHPNGGFGFKFEEDGKSFVFLTDNELNFDHGGGLSFEQYVERCKDTDLLIHDAEYRPEEYKMTRSWGHSMYLDALELALKSNVKRFGIFHHNIERKDDDLRDMVETCRQKIAESASSMECFALTETTEIII